MPPTLPITGPVLVADIVRSAQQWGLPECGNLDRFVIVRQAVCEKWRLQEAADGRNKVNE